MTSGLVGDRFTMVCTLVLAVEMHGKRVVQYFSNYHGNGSFALQLPPSKPPPGICSDMSGTSAHTIRHDDRVSRSRDVKHPSWGPSPTDLT